MEAIAAWASAIIAAIALIVGFLTYRSQRGKSRLEYIVLTNTRVVPRVVTAKLEVIYNDMAIPDASVVVIRIVNTGDKAIPPEDFKTELVVHTSGAKKIISALVTKARPADLHLELSIKEDRVLVDPFLINPEDMIEIQLLVSGYAHQVLLEGRIVGVTPAARRELPYPPGTGPGGEFANGFEKFMMYGSPSLAIALIASFVIFSPSLNPLMRSGVASFVIVFAFFLNPMYIRYLIRRRRLWAS
ncbi:hypothetical protein AB0J63_35685 [Streptosporangium canum]|uniref:hypothetical protein n=1 Tax=Streptosporangium canum TaxID=324952 RepID=UPI00342F592E